MKSATALVLLVCLFAPSCKRVPVESESGAEPRLRIAMREPGSVDPAFLATTTDFQVAANLHQGLFTWDPVKNAAVPALAASFKHDDQAQVWEFTIDSAARYSDGTAVSARDFEFAWKRILDPATASPDADALYIIKGGRAFAQGGPVPSGVRALNDATLRVELEGPQPFLPEMLRSPRFGPLPRRAFSHPASDLLAQESPVFSGPYQVKHWDKRGGMTLVANPHFTGWGESRFAEVEIHFTSSEDTALTWYQTRQVDLVAGLVPFAKIRYLKDKYPGEVVEIPMKSVFYYVVNLQRPPLDSVVVRRALYAGIDRRTLTRDVLGAGQLPAEAFIPPGYQETLGFEPGRCRVQDLDSARAELTEDLINDVAGLELMSNASETLKCILEFTQQSLKERTDLYLAVRLMEWNSFLSLVRKGDFDVARMSLAGGADPVDFLDNFTSAHPNNFARFLNPEYDELVDRIHSTAERKMRFDLMRQAHDLLCLNLPAVPVYYSSQVYLVRGVLGDSFAPDGEGIVRWQHLLPKPEAPR